MAMKVAIWGATGATGSELLRQCLADEHFEEVRTFSRRSCDVSHAKHREYQVENFLAADSYADLLTEVDVAFWCLGVAQSSVSDEARYREITCGYMEVAITELLAASPGVAFHFVSAMGAGGRRWPAPMWARLKGEAEAMLRATGLRRLVIWRPGYIAVDGGRENPTRTERLWEVISPLFRLVPNLVNPVEKVARAMVREAIDGRDRSGAVLRTARDIGREN